MLTPQLDIGDLHSPLLVFGGPYSNLRATQALLAEAEKRSIPSDHIICTGDVVAYAAEPEHTSQLLKDSGIHLVMGNCEESLAEDKNDCGCGFEEGMLCSTLSEGWYRYAQSRVSGSMHSWMRQLPRLLRFTMAGQRCAVIHGGVSQINRFIFVSTDIEIKRREINQAECDIIVAGHCGLPFGQAIDDKLWLNAGVIGLPANDASVDGWYMLMEPEYQGLKVSWHRLAYDYLRTYQSMTAAGLYEYATTIKTGLWPSMDILPDPEQKQQGQQLKIRTLSYRC